MNEPISKYEKKIRELHGEIEISARQLAQVKTQREQVLTEITSLEREKNDISRKVSVLNQELISLDFKIESKSLEEEKNVKLRQEAFYQYNLEIKELERQKRELEKQLKSIKIKVDLLLKKENELLGLDKGIEVAKEELLDIVKEYNKVTEDTLKESALIEKERKELREERKKNEEVIIRSEKNLRLVEHYVKRLQRRYDKKGIKIDLLTQFNIKRDKV